MPTITENQVKLVLAAIAAVCSYLLIQTDVPLEPIVNLILGAVIVFLAVLNPGSVAARTEK